MTTDVLDLPKAMHFIADAGLMAPHHCAASGSLNPGSFILLYVNCIVVGIIVSVSESSWGGVFFPTSCQQKAELF